MSTEHDLCEYKDGYRDGLNASVVVAKVCAADPTASAADVLTLLKTLAESSVIQTKPREDQHT